MEDFLKKVKQMNELLKEFNDHNCQIRVDDDPVWYISEVEYNSEKDEVFFKCKEKALEIREVF
jgi:hypothetical protein